MQEVERYGVVHSMVLAWCFLYWHSVRRTLSLEVWVVDVLII